MPLYVQCANFQLETELFSISLLLVESCFVVLQLPNDSVMVSKEVLRGSLSEQFCGFISNG